MEMEVKRLYDEVAILKTAIEEAIREGQKLTDGFDDISSSDAVSNKDFVLTHMNAGSEVVGWVDDF